MFLSPGPQEAVHSQVPVEATARKEDAEVNQASANSGGNKPDGAPLEIPGGGQESEQVKPGKPDEGLKVTDHENSPSKDQSLVAHAAVDKDKNANPSAPDPNAGSAPKPFVPPVSQTNRPSDNIDEETLDKEKSLPSRKDLTPNADDDDKTNQGLPKLENEEDIEGENPGLGDNLTAPKPLFPDQKNEKELKAGILFVF